ncbi:hypothetical protein FA15DRAFT_546176, partial [Coprinopsis marcescibilis]
KIGFGPCGWCGLNDDRCKTEMVWPKKQKSLKLYSTCEYSYIKMQYAASQNSTMTAPCTNAPINCAMC